MVVTGVLIGMANAERLYDSPAFLVKMIALLAGVILVYGATRPIALAEGEVSGGAKVATAAALLIWLGGAEVDLNAFEPVGRQRHAGIAMRFVGEHGVSFYSPRSVRIAPVKTDRRASSDGPSLVINVSKWPSSPKNTGLTLPSLLSSASRQRRSASRNAACLIGASWKCEQDTPRSA